MGNMIWFLVGWVAVAILVWMVWVKILRWYLLRKANEDESTINRFVAIIWQVCEESKRDGRFAEWMRFLIFPCGIVQRTTAIMKAIRTYQEEAQ